MSEAVPRCPNAGMPCNCTGACLPRAAVGPMLSDFKPGGQIIAPRQPPLPPAPPQFIVRHDEWTGEAWMERLTDPMPKEAALECYRLVSTRGAIRNVTLVPVS